jgi:hypothetical protein
MWDKPNKKRNDFGRQPAVPQIYKMLIILSSVTPARDTTCRRFVSVAATIAARRNLCSVKRFAEIVDGSGSFPS